jgi:hypothetical protein
MLCARTPRVGDTFGDLCTRVIIEIGRGVKKLHWFVLTVGKRGSDDSGQRDYPPPEPEPARLQALCICIPRLGGILGDLCTQRLMAIGLGVDLLRVFVPKDCIVYIIHNESNV